MKVLAVGAAGDAAGMVVPELVKRGISVRGLVHSEEKEAKAMDAGAAETVVADVSDLDALTKAAQGVDGVFGIIPVFQPNEADIGVNIVRAAERVNAGKIVFSSVYHPSLPLSNHAAKQPAEAAMYDSELDFTILQPAVFMAQLRGLFASARESGTIAQAWSAEQKVAYVDYREVAEIAARAFIEDYFSYGTFELSGPGMFDRHEVARLMSDSLGREVSARAPSFQSFADEAGIPPGPARDGLEAMMGHYDEHGFHGGNATVLEALLGRSPTSVPAYIEELARI